MVFNMSHMYILSVCISLSVFTTVICSPKVIIVGAGASGLAAATKLFQNNITNVTILEAQNRIGGRVYTIKFDNISIDLGAEFVHGQKGNIVYEMTEKYNLLDYDRNKYEKVFLRSDGKLVSENVRHDMLNLIKDFMSEREKHAEHDKIKISLGQKFIQNYTKLIDKYRNSSEEYRTIVDALGTMPYLFDPDGTHSWFEDAYSNGIILPQGKSEITWNGNGYSKFFDILVQKYPNASKELPVYENIKFKKTVVLIQYGKSKGQVKIKCSDGSTYTGDHVIFTPSLGVLKAKYKTIFDPPLARNKVYAIQTLGFDGVLRVTLRFEKPWWNSSSLTYIPVYSEEDQLTLAAKYPKGPIKCNKSWLNYIKYFFTYYYDPHLMKVWFVGDVVPDLEAMSNENIKDGIMFALKKFFGNNFNITEPDRIVKTNWHSNPYFRGSFTFEGVNVYQSKENLHEVYAAPILNSKNKPVVLFAGEATSSNHYSSVHGAVETGFREADRIIKYNKNNTG